MAARAALLEVLKTDAELLALGFGKVYSQNEIDTPVEPRFVVVRWEQTGDRPYASVAPERAAVWFHDKDRTYGTIDKGLDRVRQLMTELLHVEGVDGWVLTQAQWNSNGPDLFDAGFGTLTKWANITVSSRYDTP